MIADKELSSAEGKQKLRDAARDAKVVLLVGLDSTALGPEAGLLRESLQVRVESEKDTPSLLAPVPQPVSFAARARKGLPGMLEGPGRLGIESSWLSPLGRCPGGQQDPCDSRGQPASQVCVKTVL